MEQPRDSSSEKMGETKTMKNETKQGRGEKGARKAGKGRETRERVGEEDEWVQRVRVTTLRSWRRTGCR